MSHLPRFHVNGEPNYYGPGAFEPVVPTNPDPRFPPRQRAQEVQSTAPAPSAQNPPTRSDYPSRRPATQSTALPTPPADVPPLPASAFLFHRPAVFKDAITESARVRWPASGPGPSCKVRAGQVAPPRADATDAWHNTSVLMYYPSLQSVNTLVPIAIPFAPTHGPGLEGVAMTELVRGRGVLDPDTPIGEFFHPECKWAGARGRLAFEWPGYYYVQTFNLRLQDDKGRYVPRAAFGMQIARHVHSFIENFGDSDPFQPGRSETAHVRLGRHGIRYEQLRLLEVISFNGQDFYLRVAAVALPPRSTTT